MSEISLTGDQMLAVLETVAKEGPISAAEAARRRGINRTVAHRLLTTLANRSYVRRTDDGYVLGPAAGHLSHGIEVSIEEASKPHMMKLAQHLGETVVLHGVSRLDAVVLDQAVGARHLVRVQHTPGSRHSLCRGASGWAILAFQSEKVINRVLKSGVCGKDAEARITKVRLDGYAVSHDELQLGVHGIAAPLFAHSKTCEASLGILVPSVRADSIMNLRAPLLDAAGSISRDLSR